MGIELTVAQRRMVAKAKRDKVFETKVKIAIAEMFRLPTHKHVNIEKSLLFINYRKSSQHKLEQFLDSLTDPKAQVVESEGEILA